MLECRLCYCDDLSGDTWSAQQIAAGRQIEVYLAKCIAYIRNAFAERQGQRDRVTDTNPDEILKCLVHRDFNYQAKGRVAHLIDDVRSRVQFRIDERLPLRLLMLYHGGYRTSSDALSALIFKPDATELLLIFQMARMQVALSRVYSLGASFDIVINNDVAARTNDIRIEATKGYVEQLRNLIGALGAGTSIGVLVQSELCAGEEAMQSLNSVPIVDEASHRIVERFLGRSCSIAEAQHRSSLYLEAERAWGMDLARIYDADASILLRQVAHPATLSFRPFPGGAIRVQNGSIGFRVSTCDRDPIPFLVTSSTVQRGDLLSVPVRMAAFTATLA